MLEGICLASPTTTIDLLPFRRERMLEYAAWPRTYCDCHQECHRSFIGARCCFRSRGDAAYSCTVMNVEKCNISAAATIALHPLHVELGAGLVVARSKMFEDK
ncbi:hypothetical protein NDU88_006413 [Pleurodeles waltl]|uniref:Uncharacterized protein n=1 Tax=Pleurodeles waltl TaxID=8319 RepID=A0AAV7UNX2_PLEWA|nr:hypothetical protein NDU88_006413 [Pleurodeles waltl]